VGALANPDKPIKLFARGADGALQSYAGGLLGFTMVGDIRALVYVSQGINVKSPVGEKSYLITGVGEQGKKILSIGEGLTPKELLASLKVGVPNYDMGGSMKGRLCNIEIMVMEFSAGWDSRTRCGNRRCPRGTE